MDYGEIISDSINYSRNALVGNWRTWLVFIFCSLPFALMGLLFDPEKIKAATVDWSLFPWTQFFALLLVGFLLSFFTTGYLVRVFRGITPPPKFGDWASLYIDGIKVMIVEIVWFFPSVVFLTCTIILFSLLSPALKGLGLDLPILIASLLFMVIAIALMIVAILCIFIATVHYARTGSIREGIRYSAVFETIRAIGWGSYIIALIVLLITAIIYFLVVSVFGLIPFIGWVINLALDSLFAVFLARYLSRVYDHAAPSAPPVTVPAAGI
jgi:hypothetical protein